MAGNGNTLCVVRGEMIEHSASLGDLEKRRLNGFRRPDGVFTNVGAICGVCLPAYQAAVDAYTDLSHRRNGVAAKLRDPAFVAGALRDFARDRVLGIVDFARGHGLSLDIRARELRDFLLRGVALKDYIDDEALGGVRSGIRGELGLKSALACINEESRTFKFILALFRRLDELEKKREIIEVVDAGSGPLALFGILAALKSQKVRVTCLECNTASVEMARKIVANLGLTDRVNIVSADATQYRHCGPIDLLISETLNTGLLDEDFGRIFKNLVPQVAEDGEIIPEWVSVKADLVALLDASLAARKIVSNPLLREGVRHKMPLDVRRALDSPVEVLKITRDQIGLAVDCILPTDGLPDDTYRLLLSNEVGLYGDEIVLNGNDSIVTSPMVVPGSITIDDATRGSRLRMKYALGDPSTGKLFQLEKPSTADAPPCTARL